MPTGRRTHSVLMQAAFLAVVLGIVAAMVVTAHTNLVTQHIASGFGFLNTQTGWDVASSLMTHSSSDPYWRTFLVGLLNTLLVAAVCILLATVLGFGLGFLSVASNPLVSGACLVYVNTFRNIPQILQLFFWYNLTRQFPPVRNAIPVFDVAFLSNRGLNLPLVTIVNGTPWLLAALPVVLILSVPGLRQRLARAVGASQTLPYVLAGLAFLAGVALLPILLGCAPPNLQIEIPHLAGFNFQGGLLLSPEFVALVTAIVFYNIAFIAEIIRSGVNSVAFGQIEAARSLGLRDPVIFRKVIIVQALRVVVPPLTSQYISLTKSTSLAIAIGYTELFQVATIAINNTGQSIENIAILMVIYMTLSGCLSALGALVAVTFRWSTAT
jgi:general L-amino acid transport system permease protein